MRSEAAIGFLRVPARRLVRQVCGLVAAPPVTEAAASRSPHLADPRDASERTHPFVPRSFRHLRRFLPLFNTPSNINRRVLLHRV